MVLYGSAEHVGDFPRSPSSTENVAVSQSESGVITASTSRTTVVIILNEYIQSEVPVDFFALSSADTLNCIRCN